MSYALRPKQVNFDSVWQHLETSINRIIRLDPIDRKSWDDSFSDIYAVCVAIPDPLGERLYFKTKECLEAHVRLLYDNIRTCNDSNLLEVYYRCWQQYFDGAKFIHNLFGYLNKQFVKSRRQSDNDLYYGTLAITAARSHEIMEIGELALNIWQQILLAPIESQLLSHLLNAINADRNHGGDSIHHTSIVQGVIMSFVQVEEFSAAAAAASSLSSTTLIDNTVVLQLDAYRRIFEQKFLEATSQHYVAEASRLLAECNISQYMEKVIQIIGQEDVRSRRYLHQSSFEKVTKILQDVMVCAHRERLYAVCREMVRSENRHDLKNMYKLLKPITNGLSVLVKEFEIFVKQTGLAGVENLKGDNVPQQFVENVLFVYKKFNTMVTELFSDDGDFVGALDKALQMVVNFKEESRTCPKASEWLARYTDTLLRKSAKGLSETEVDTKLTLAIIIFRYIEDKDIFQKFYSRMLAQRLIHAASVSMDAEEQMIAKLKQACGYEYSSKLQRMFLDVGLSKELTDKFIAHQHDNGINDLQMQILVLQQGSWPLVINHGAQNMLAVPVQLQPSIQHFERFYTSTHTGRKLTWLYSLANADVKLNYLDKPYQVTMSVQQLALLLCFEKHNQVCISEIESVTQLTGDALIKVIRTLLESGIIAVAASSSKIGTNESDDALLLADRSIPLSLNVTFTSKRLKFKITAPVMQRQAEKETEQVNATVNQDRKYYMECTIVRVMKTRKVLKHNALVNEVIEQTKSRFTPDINFIKKNIEALIDKQYIQRTDQNDEYQYLA